VLKHLRENEQQQVTKVSHQAPCAEKVFRRNVMLERWAVVGRGSVLRQRSETGSSDAASDAGSDAASARPQFQAKTTRSLRHPYTLINLQSDVVAGNAQASWTQKLVTDAPCKLQDT
jgi:hypothetical protein